MRYEYKTPEELEAERPQLKPGEADFEIAEATNAISKSSGKPMIKLVVKVWDCDGQSGNLFDYLVPHVPFKIKQITDAVGKPEWYAPEFDLTPEMLVGMSGKCILGKERKSKNPDYANREPRIVISMYKAIHESSNETKKDDNKGEEFTDDDIPF